jgi:hypothetical protein
MTTAAAEPPGLGTWQTATVVRVRQETPAAKTFTLELPEPRGHPECGSPWPLERNRR